jgi:hypothetical protein
MGGDALCPRFGAVLKLEGGDPLPVTPRLVERVAPYVRAVEPPRPRCV